VSVSAADHQRGRVPRRSAVAGWSLTARAFNAVGWSYFAGSIFLVAQLGYTALTARLVAPRWFGGYALALNTVQIAALAAGVLGNAVMRAHELTDRGARTALTLAITSGLLLAGVLVALSSPIQYWFHAPGAAGSLRVLALQPPMLAAAGVAYGLLRRGRRYRAASLIDLMSCLVGFGIGAAATVAGLGVIGLSLGQVVRSAVAMVVGLACARLTPRPAFDRAPARDFTTFSAQVTGQNVGHYAIANLPLWSVARLAGGATTGLFSRGYQLVALPADQFAGGLMRALYPLYREINTTRERTRRALTDGLTLTSCSCAIVFGVFAVFVQPAAILLLGPRWAPAAAITPMLCAFAAINTLYSVLASAAEAFRWMRMIWLTQLAFLLAMGTLLFAASGRLEATAVAMIVASAVSHLFMLVWVSLKGLLYTGEIAQGYSVHLAVGMVIAVMPPLLSYLTGWHEILPVLCVRAAVLAVIALALWMLRDWIPGIRLGLRLIREVRGSRAPRHARKSSRVSGGG
jgi:O-antigen/teichoic acid export membrane protein